MQYLVNTDSKKNDLHINIDPLLDLVYRMIATSLKNGRFFFVWMHRWMDGWIDGSMDAWMDAWMDGWVDGWMDG